MREPEPPNQPPADPGTPRPAGAACHASTRDWPGYYDAVVQGGAAPRDTLLTALDRFEAEAPPDGGEPPESGGALAIDLGCGEGRDTIELLRRGWRVLAIDSEAEGIRRLLAREVLQRHSAWTTRLRTMVSSFEDAPLERCRLLNASFALPFCPPEAFSRVWADVVASIEPGGRFAGQLFGERDSWASLPDRSHQTRGEAEALLKGLEVERFDEEEADRADARGYMKHWHVFHIVARKPMGA